MSTSAASSPAALALIASGNQWSSRALESALQPSGYRVVRAVTGALAAELTRRERPDVILVAGSLPDVDGVDLCRALRHDSLVTPGLPIVGIASDVVGRDQRLGWLRAGAWDCFGFPLDLEELLLKLEAYVQAKRAADRAGTPALVDGATGLYTGPGLERRARELVAEALRLHAPLACAVFGPELGPAHRGATGAALGTAAVRARVGSVLRTQGRLSDTIGWWNGAAFAVLAPATDAQGAVKLAQRLAHAVEAAPPEPGVSARTLEVRVGYEAVADVHAAPVESGDLLARASAALARARSQAGGSRIQRFEAGP